MKLNKLVLGSVICGLLAQAVMAQTTIIQDSFTGSGNLPSHSPEINLTGTGWAVSGNPTFWGPPVLENNSVRFNTDNGVAINLQENYTLPGKMLTLSADLNVSGIGADDGFKRGVYLGFYKAATLHTTVGTVNFLGLLLDASNGSLNLVDYSVNGAQTVISSKPYQGSWNKSGFHSLSYTIDTVTGSILSATLDSQDYTFAATSAFAAANLKWVGCGASAAGGGQAGYVDNFVLKTKPEEWRTLAANWSGAGLASPASATATFDINVSAVNRVLSTNNGIITSPLAGYITNLTMVVNGSKNSGNNRTFTASDFTQFYLVTSSSNTVFNPIGNWVGAANFSDFGFFATGGAPNGTSYRRMYTDSATIHQNGNPMDLVVIPTPGLGISTYGGNPAVFYPTTTGTNYVLQMTTNLTSGNWVTVTNGVPITGVMITNPPANVFFRLQ